MLPKRDHTPQRYVTRSRYTLAKGVFDWLEEVLHPDVSVLEFGSGYSTVFLAERVARLVTIETDDRWYNHSQEKLSKYENAMLLRTRRLLQKGDAFDIVIIDGGIRRRNLAHAIPLFTKFLVFDDVHIPKWKRLSEVVDQHFERERTIWEIPARNRYLHRKTLIWNATPKKPLNVNDFRTRICPQWRQLDM